MNKRRFVISAIVLFLSVYAYAQDWVVPAESKNEKNPSAYSLENVKKGKDLYLQNCKSCHGDPGKNNGLPLVPHPPDIISDQMQANSEGELFFKITHGRGPMPQFETNISEDDRWRIVNYIQNFNPENEPLIVNAPPVKAKILASVNEADRKVEVFAEYDNKGVFTKLTNTAITISAKKTFGNLKMGEIMTDENGRAVFSIPDDVIGDEDGYVNIVVNLGENFTAENVILDKAKVGQRKEVPKLIKKGEVIWSTNENIQIWLLLSYIAAAGGAWIAIGYVIFQIVKIKRLGKN